MNHKLLSLAILLIVACSPSASTPSASVTPTGTSTAAATQTPSAISAGIESPIGEPFAMLPQSVALLRIGTDANRCQTSASSG